MVALTKRIAVEMSHCKIRPTLKLRKGGGRNRELLRDRRHS